MIHPENGRTPIETAEKSKIRPLPLAPGCIPYLILIICITL